MQKKRFIQKTALPLIAAVLCSFPSHAGWEPMPTSDPSLTIKGPWRTVGSKIDTSLGALQARYNDSDKDWWLAYYTNSAWEGWSDVKDGQSFNLVSSFGMEGWNKIYGGSQLVKYFDFSQASIEDASKVRISFDVIKRQPISFDVGVNPWSASANLASGISLLAEPGKSKTVFNFSIIDLVTGNIILSDQGADWHHSGIDDQSATISFLLEGANLAPDRGYAFVATAVYADGTQAPAIECYQLTNMLIEKYVESIPEPSTTGLLLLSAGSLIFRRRMK